MKKAYLIGAMLIVVVGIFLLGINKASFPSTNAPQNNNIINQTGPTNANAASDQPRNTNANGAVAEFQPPLPRSGERVTKKPFGIFITPQNSPIQPEKFSGYHTGADFEVFPEELNSEVEVRAVCSGELRVKEYASGYGGAAVEACLLEGAPITVVYGHLKLDSITAQVGAALTAGDKLGILGANNSTETNGERKHLHLGLHRGSTVNIRGYVNTQTELTDWIDPCLYVCRN